MKALLTNVNDVVSHGISIFYGIVVVFFVSWQSVYGQSSYDLQNENTKDGMFDSLNIENRDYVIPNILPEISLDKYDIPLSITPSLSNDRQQLNQYDLFNSRFADKMKENRLQSFGSHLYGVSSQTFQKNLILSRSAAFVLDYNKEKFQFKLGIVANQYETQTLKNQFGVTANIDYTFSPNLFMTLFGNFYNNTPYFSMATYPYVSTSSYGGYLNYHNNNVGIKMGAMQYYDPFMRSWKFEPIVTPVFRVSKRIILELPVGPLIQKTLEDVLRKNRNRSPNIEPSF